MSRDFILSLLDDRSFPSGYNELINLGKKLRVLFYDKIKNSTSDVIENSISETKEIIYKLASEINEYNQKKICILLYLILKIVGNDGSFFKEIIRKFNFSKKDDCSIYSSFIDAKICHVSDNAYVSSRINDIKNYSGKKHYPLPYFLFFLAKHSLNYVCIDSIGIFGCFSFIKDDITTHDIAKKIYQSVHLYLKILENTQIDKSYIVDRFYKEGANFVHNRPIIYICFLIGIVKSESYSAEFKFIESAFSYLRNFIEKYSSDMAKEFAFYALSLASRFDKNNFLTRYKDLYIKLDKRKFKMHYICKAYLKIIKYFPEEYLEFQEAYNSLLDYCISSKNLYCYKLLKVLVDQIDIYTQQKIETLERILPNLNFCEYYANYVPYYIDNCQSLWDTVKEIIMGLLSKRNVFGYVELLLLVNIPVINNGSLLQKISNEIRSENEEIRSLALVAYLKHTSLMDNEKKLSIVEDMLARCTYEMSSMVKNAILDSFNEEHYKYLVSSTNIEYLSILLNDDDYKIKKTVVSVLCKLALARSIHVLPILRKIVLDSVYLLQMKKNDADKVEQSEILYELCGIPEIIQLYVSIVFKAFKSHFSQLTNNNMTYFEIKNYHKIGINLINSMARISNAGVCLSLYAAELIDHGLNILNNFNDNDIRVSAAKMLIEITSNYPDSYEPIRVSIYNNISRIASKWNSPQLNYLFFKVLAILGAINQQESIQLNTILRYDHQLEVLHGDLYHKTVCSTLIEILNLSVYRDIYHKVADTMVVILGTNEECLHSYFKQFMPLFISLLRKADPKTSSSISLIDSLKHLYMNTNPDWLVEFSDDILTLVFELLENNIYPQLITLFPIFASVLHDKFGPFLPRCISFLLDCLSNNKLSEPRISTDTINSLVKLRNISGDFFYLIIPELCSIISDKSIFKEVREAAMLAISALSQSIKISAYSSQIIKVALENITYNSNEFISMQSISIILTLSYVLGKEFDVYKDQTLLIFKKNNINEDIINKIKHYSKDRRINIPEIPNQNYQTKDSIAQAKSNTFKSKELIRALDFKDPEFPLARTEWFWYMVNKFIELSPISCISKVSPIAKVSNQIAAKLFNAAFLSCWKSFCKEDKCIVRQVIKDALSSQSIIDQPRGLLIILVEFMERMELSLGFEYSFISDICISEGHYAIAYYFSTKWFEKDPSQVTREKLISLSSLMGDRLNVIGLIKNFNSADNEILRPHWYELLEEWDNAIDGYQNEKNLPGIVRCLFYSHDYCKIASMKTEILSLEESQKLKVLHLLLYSLKERGDYEAVIDLCNLYNPKDFLSNISVAEAYYNVDKSNIEKCDYHMQLCYDAIARDNQLTFKQDNLIMFDLISKAMIINELSEEILKKKNISVWEKRLSLYSKSFNDIYRILSFRIPYVEEPIKSKYITIMLKSALKSRNWSSFNKILPEKSERSPAMEVLDCISAWERGNKTEALDKAEELRKLTMDDTTLAKVNYMIGFWTLRSVTTDLDNSLLEKTSEYICTSYKLCPNSYKISHCWAWICSNLFEKNKQRTDCAINAIKGFIKCINLKSDHSFSDLIQLVNIVFKVTLDPEILKEIRNAIKTLSPETITSIYPQIFAHLSDDIKQNSEFSYSLISTLLLNNFHSILYPLFQHVRDSGINEKLGKAGELSKKILAEFSDINSTAVKEGQILVDGLYDAAKMSCEQMWINNLEKYLTVAYSKVSDRKNDAGTKQYMEFYHKFVSLNTPESKKFLFLYDKDYIDRINKSMRGNKAYNRNKEKCEEFKDVLERKVKSIRMYKLSELSPKLSNMKNLCLAVPGTHVNANKVIRISSFSPLLWVVVSKQRPKILCIHGSNGESYNVLLKGNEDLRLDQRVMQFFKLINVQMKTAKIKTLKDIHIITYSIIPLSINCGMIQFINDSKTILALIRSYRILRDKQEDIEKKFASDNYIDNIDSLTRVQRLEYVNEAYKSIPCNDLHEMIYLSSPSSNEWMTRKIRFTKSNSVMSFVGYILGLGDRHPSNILVCNKNCDVVHIDFNDCFEVARYREILPEKVPFRLTRMMVSAFGPAGVEGNFRITMEEIARIARINSESIRTILDIFLQVPLEGGDLPNMNFDIKKSIEKVSEKVMGIDISSREELSVEDQVDKLIIEATSTYNLAAAYHGWSCLW